MLSEQYKTSYLFYVTLSFLCNIICYQIYVFAFSLVDPFQGHNNNLQWLICHKTKPNQGSLKVNTIAWLEFKLAYYDVTVQHATGTLHKYFELTTKPVLLQSISLSFQADNYFDIQHLQNISGWPLFYHICRLKHNFKSCFPNEEDQQEVVNTIFVVWKSWTGLESHFKHHLQQWNIWKSVSVYIWVYIYNINIYI